MITPEEIQKIEFTRVVRGYKEDEVNAFLDRVTVDLDNIITENAALKETIQLLDGEIDRYKSAEGTILETLESAKELMSDISASAEKRADILLKNAELDADRIRREAHENVERMTEESTEMMRRLLQFKVRFKNLLQNELDRFDTLSSDLLIESEAAQMNYIPERSTQISVSAARTDVKPRDTEVAQSETPPLAGSNIRNSTIKTAKIKL
ncbi:MAG: DivIVA domain-containing protein [Clostridiales Family XIII bacterium]|nr:DivIVA domain-containing protein [Clostridiales Family XIII bacterium]